MAEVGFPRTLDVLISIQCPCHHTGTVPDFEAFSAFSVKKIHNRNESLTSYLINSQQKTGKPKLWGLHGFLAGLHCQNAQRSLWCWPRLGEGNGHRWLTGVDTGDWRGGWIASRSRPIALGPPYSGGNCSTASTRVSETKIVEIWAMESGIPGLGTTDWLVQLLTLWCWGFLTRPHTSYL